MRRLDLIVRSELTQIFPSPSLETEWPVESNIRCPVEERIKKCSDVLSGITNLRNPHPESSLLCWFENEVLEVRVDVIDNSTEMKRRIDDVRCSMENELGDLMKECINLGIIGGTARPDRGAPDPLKAVLPDLTHSLSLHSTQSSISTKQRINEWKMNKSRRKQDSEAQQELQRRLESEDRKQELFEQIERRKMVETYRKQKKEDHESESRAIATAHLAAIKLRQDQYISLGTAERNRARGLKYLERRKVTPVSVKLIRARQNTSPKPSKLYHPTKCSLNHSTASLLAKSQSTPKLFTPYLSRYSII